MTNELIEGISIALGEEFGEACGIHTEVIEQNLEEPCFFIQCLGPSRELIRGGRHQWTNPFCIQYFPQSKEHGRRECYDAADRMMGRLERIAVCQTTIQGTKMRYELDTEAGILNYFVNYDCITAREEVSAFMDSLETRAEVKEGG